MIEAYSGQKAVLVWTVPLRASTILMSSTGWDFQLLHWLTPPDEPVGVMPNWVIRRGQPIVIFFRTISKWRLPQWCCPCAHRCYNGNYILGCFLYHSLWDCLVYFLTLNQKKIGSGMVPGVLNIKNEDGRLIGIKYKNGKQYFSSSEENKMRKKA